MDLENPFLRVKGGVRIEDVSLCSEQFICNSDAEESIPVLHLLHLPSAWIRDDSTLIFGAWKYMLLMSLKSPIFPFEKQEFSNIREVDISALCQYFKWPHSETTAILQKSIPKSSQGKNNLSQISLELASKQKGLDDFIFYSGMAWTVLS